LGFLFVLPTLTQLIGFVVRRDQVSHLYKTTGKIIVLFDISSGYYAGVVVISYRRYRTIYWSHLPRVKNPKKRAFSSNKALYGA